MSRGKVLLIIIIVLLASCSDPFDPRAPFDNTDSDDTLVGTTWKWDNPYGGVTLYFETEIIVVYSDEEYCDYTYKDITKTGSIAGYGTFTVSPDYTHISFAQWKQYPHGAEFIRE
ncbi:hypothetical protein FACS189494_06420 [Spirochaetia bacterium]|nr:hypothetical protein FACS189494_06420 [Spirochaetia bacterium]